MLSGTCRTMIKLKLLLRSPVKTALTFVLLGAVTFALFTQVSEYAVASRELKSAAELYDGLGAFEDRQVVRINPFLSKLRGETIYEHNPVSPRDVEAIAALPYVTIADARYMTSGVSDDFERIFRRQANSAYSNRCVIEGTLTQINTESKTLVLTNAVPLAGNLPWGHVNKYVLVRYYDIDGAAPSKYDTRYIERNMAIGKRYAFVVSADTESFAATTTAHLRPDPAEEWCEAIWHIDSTAESYLTSDEYAPLRILIDIIDSDLRTFDVVYTTDMKAIKRFSEGDMMIREGRALSRDDAEMASRVCIVSAEFSSANSVGVGDTITLKLGSRLFTQLSTLGALSVVHPRYSPPGEPVDLEVVGVYLDTDELSKRNSKPNLNYSINTIFVPTPLLPIGLSELEGHPFAPSELGFVVADAMDIPSFIEECVPVIEDMKLGLTLAFNDGGWLDISDGYSETAKTTAIKILVFAAAVILSTGFAVFLYIGRRKTEYAIMRALGTSRRDSAIALIVPLLLVTAASVLTGVAAAWVFVSSSIERSELLLSLRQGSLDTSIPVSIVFYCAFCEVMVSLLFAYALLRRMGSMPPLVLLQADSKHPNRASASVAPSANPVVVQGPGVSAPAGRYMNLQHKATGTSAAYRVTSKRSFGFIVRYVIRHIRRTAGKSALMALLAIILLIVVSRFSLVRQSYIELIETTNVTIRIVGGARLSLVPRIMDSGYVRGAYYEVSASRDINNCAARLTVTNDFARFAGEEVSIVYGDGYDESYLGELCDIVFIGSKFAAAHEIAAGDTVSLRLVGHYESIMSRYLGSPREWAQSQTAEELRELYRDDVEKEADKQTDYFVVAGIFTTPSGDFDGTVFTPGSLDSFILTGVQSVLSEVEYTLDRNTSASEFRDYCYENISGISAGRSELIMDTSKFDGLMRTLNLLDLLNPIVYSAALLIGCILCCIITLQALRESALMRALGTSRLKITILRSLEQSLLVVPGMALGILCLCAISWLSGRASSDIGIGNDSVAFFAGGAEGGSLRSTIRAGMMFSLAYFVTVFASTATCSAVSARKRVIALLQVRE